MKHLCRSLSEAWIPARTLISWRICHILRRLGMDMIVSVIHNYEDRRDTKLILKKYPLRISAPAVRLGMIDWRSSDEPILKRPLAIPKKAMWLGIGSLVGCEIVLAQTFFSLETVSLNNLAMFYMGTIVIALMSRKLLDHSIRADSVFNILLDYKNPLL